MQNIFLDCTHTYNSGLNTGIQRVVKNIVKNSFTISKELDVNIIPVILKNNQYYKFDFFPKISERKNRIKSILKFFYIKIRSLSPSSIQTKLYSSNVTVSLNNLTDRLLFGSVTKTNHYVNMKEDDILFLIDTTWLNNNYSKYKQLKIEKIKIIALVYDIIPIMYPQFCTEDLTNSVKDWYKQIVPYIDFYIAISDTVKDEVYNYIKLNYRKDIPYENFNSFYLGSNFTSNLNKEFMIIDSYKKLFLNNNTYLTVSTIEPRKNHSYILDAFEVLWDKNIDIKYVMIGRIGWNIDDFIERVKTHKEFNKKLFLLNNVNDSELEYAYKNSKSLIFASFTEGFGLPIVESINFKLPVLVSDIPIHREIGKENVSYFNLNSKDSLVSKLLEDKQIPITDLSQTKTWHESTNDLIKKSLSFKEKNEA